MGSRAKLFMTGGSQAVRLPRQFRFPEQSEVAIWREGRRVILEPLPERWSAEFLALEGSAVDFPYPERPSAGELAPDVDFE